MDQKEIMSNAEKGREGQAKGREKGLAVTGT